VSGERINVMALLRDSANATAKNLGVWVADVRIKSIDLPKEVSETVYTRMRTKREQVATEHRSAGKAQAESIRAGADATAAVTVAQAQLDSAKIRAQGTAESAGIYAKAYQQDPGFYVFYRSLQAYITAFSGKQDFLVLTPESEFFKFFNSAQLGPVTAAQVATAKVTAAPPVQPSSMEKAVVAPAPAAAQVAPKVAPSAAPVVPPAKATVPAPEKET
jgi:membrane protease subunit HflC